MAEGDGDRMAEGDFRKAILEWLKEGNQLRMMETFDRNIVPEFGVDVAKRFIDVGTKHKNTILHKLVSQSQLHVISHLFHWHDFDINVQREYDQCAPLHLAYWYGNNAIADELLSLGADVTITNSYGEVPGVSAVPKAFTSQLQGLVAPANILQIVASDLRNFSFRDCITAFYKIAEKVCDYDAQFSNWDSTRAETKMAEFRQHSHYLSLVQRCEEALCARREESAILWATMMRALAMVHQPDVLRNLTTWVQTNPLPFRDVDDPARLEQIAWGIAKVRGSAGLWRLVYLQLGNMLSRKVSDLGARSLATIAWAFAKAGSREKEDSPDSILLQHPALFRAIANRVVDPQREPFTSPQSVSNIMWSFAKLEDHNAGTLVLSMEEEAIRLMPWFKDQHVANTIWAMARRGVRNEPLLRALLARASDTLYHDQSRNHVTMSKHVKNLHWFQVYTGYIFCKQNCPTVLDSAGNVLVQDLERIGNRDRERFEGLSEGSGLEMLADLRELDDMISAREEAEEVGFHQFGVPDDSLEAGAASQNYQAANHSNAEGVLGMIPRRGGAPETIEVIILKFVRAPEAYRKALMEGPELRECRDALEGRALLPSGAKVFVRPEHYESVMEGIRRSGLKELFTSHVIVAQEFEHLVEKALFSVPSNDRVVGKVLMALPAARAVQWDEGSQFSVKVKRTFITVDVEGSLLSHAVRRGAYSA
ncbi:unnamed protein product [Polarella glacialis]|uniref:Uncharacterized protein n=1 Tax=Polarella glacialis TaxID=89957 RepID=A0A813K8M1_POLGL|nr:unnamed protein product [Polarella glacialis]|mmetsp:Transcript_19262/g.30769  ORF Transcript_19262/g.30769 Transcript_19262/m.30769 type:complete len:707 (-) Transcript_19262:279-2399(-)|eukprot:CAMPEP_0115053372 /NCGR_PEP_ID=MMETSP0227-20121206/3471_1 /TAXON_ID=89957 /ORGANISM="Polarella glacialis, Strain CCMP 1383" /LENGTH=706 /DNA_ID=CAMNT_0002437667 /DNA_START=60 /DNA_END=2180 /DNA_ORIENTATION=-